MSGGFGGYINVSLVFLGGIFVVVIFMHFDFVVNVVCRKLPYSPTFGVSFLNVSCEIFVVSPCVVPALKHVKS